MTRSVPVGQELCQKFDYGAEDLQMKWEAFVLSRSGEGTQVPTLANVLAFGNSLDSKVGTVFHCVPFPTVL